MSERNFYERELVRISRSLEHQTRQLANAELSRKVRLEIYSSTLRQAIHLTSTAVTLTLELSSTPQDQSTLLKSSNGQ